MLKNMTKNEFSRLYALVQDKIGVEIGCGIGNITKAISGSCKRVYAVDTFDHVKVEEFVEYVKDCKNVRLIESFPHLASKIFNENELDFVFVNGEQTESGIEQTINDFYPKLKMDGVMIFHDYHTEFFEKEVLPEVKEICDRYYKVHDGSIDSMVWIIKRNEL